MIHVIACEVEKKPKLDSKLIPLKKQVGIDVGTSEANFYALSNGRKCDNPHFFHEAEKKLGKLERKLSRKKHQRNKADKTKASKNYKKGRLLFAKKTEKVSNQRLDFLCQEVNKLRKAYDFLGVENLQVNRIVEKNKKKNKWYSAKRMYDSALSLFLKKLSDKVEETSQIEIKVSPAYTSQTCSKCYEEAPVKQELSDRKFICTYCGLVLDRDVNAAKNILREAQIKEFGTDLLISQGWLEPVWKPKLEDRPMLFSSK